MGQLVALYHLLCPAVPVLTHTRVGAKVAVAVTVPSPRGGPSAGGTGGTGPRSIDREVPRGARAAVFCWVPWSGTGTLLWCV